jgi:hypothetical protein
MADGWAGIRGFRGNSRPVAVVKAGAGIGLSKALPV